MADLERLTYDSDRLIREWRDRYTGRRTIASQMLNDAEVLVRDAIVREREQERREQKTDREYDLEHRERQVEHAARLHESQLDRLRKQLAEAQLKIDSLSPRQTLMREERETVEDGTIVRLLAPTVPSYGDKSSPRPWMLGELEDVVHRLRMGGAGDDTEVRFKRDAIEACVPFAEFALAADTRRSEMATAPTTAPAVSFSARLALVGLAVGIIVAALLALVVLR